MDARGDQSGHPRRRWWLCGEVRPAGDFGVGQQDEVARGEVGIGCVDKPSLGKVSDADGELPPDSQWSGGLPAVEGGGRNVWDLSVDLAD